MTTDSPARPALSREQLRRLIRRIEQRPPPPRVTAGEHVPTLRELLPDFVARDTDGGSCCYRELRYPLGERVGDRTLDELPDVRGETLEVLAPGEGLETAAPEDMLFLDIETTGLGGAGAMAFLVGTGRLEGEHFVLRQYLALSPADEGALLDALLEDACLGDGPVLVTYNGRRFDAPVLDERATMHRRRAGFDALRQLDLLHPVRAAYGGLLQSCRLAVVEAEVLGLTRHDEDVPGAEVPQWYFQFLRSGDGRHLLPIINHNAQDVVSLGALVARLDAAIRRVSLTAFDQVAVGRLL
ncbi:MAG: ribonuclease H-like domain-containing protein, partial [Dehalococcoidia bacterium]